MATLLALLSSLLYGVSDFTGGFAARRMTSVSVVVWSQLVGLAVATLGSLVLGGEPTAADIAWGAAGGVAGNIGLVTLYRGLAVGRAAVVAPVSAVVAAVVPVAAGVAGGDRLAALRWAGVAVGLVAVWAVSAAASAEPDHERGVGYGLGAGLGFGLFFSFIAQTPDSAGLWPLVASRATSVVVLVVVASVIGRRIQSPAGAWGILALVGVGDMAANFAFLVAARIGPLSLVAVLASFYPAVTVLLARVVLHQRLRSTQLAGLGLAVVAVAMLTV